MAPRPNLDRNERGAALVLVLVFITAVALVVSALLFGTSTAEKSTVVTASLANAYYAADSGVEYGLSKLRAANGLCPAGGTYTSLPDGLTRDQTITVTCGGGQSAEAAEGATGWAVATFSPNPNSLTNQQAVSTEKQISGPTFVNGGFDLKAALRANTNPPDPASPTYPLGDGLGAVYQHKPPCVSAAASKPDKLITPNFGCTGLTVDDVDPKTPLPPVPATSRPRGPAKTVVINGVQCGVFLPGTYADDSPSGNPPNPLGLLSGAGKANYLASGIYYFKNIGEINLNDYTVFAGEDPSEPKTLSPSPCATDADAVTAAAVAPSVPTGITTDDRGAQLILGGNSWLDASKADAEFLAYRPATAGVGGRGISIRTVPPSPPAGYAESLPGGVLNGLGLTVATGNNPHFSVHGMVYAKNARVVLNSTNTAAAQVLGGVMAWELDLNASASATGLVVQITGERPRARSKVVIEATVPVSGTKDVTARAVADVYVDPPSRTVTDGRTYAGASATTVTSATAKFLPADKGSHIFGGTIPPKTHITAVNSATSVTISQAATLAQSPIELTIDPSTRTTAGKITNGIDIVTFSPAGFFTQADVGAGIFSVEPNGEPDYAEIPGGTKILAVNDATNTIVLSQKATKNDASATLSVTRRRITVSVVSWRVENP